ncbi:MAG: hypothetical protein E7619_05280 [Ruminococcaceae bacterium]|nr:hypothetical protein [Oscillospiraceae bacterium]
MNSFYGEITDELPCVICDAGMRVVFANQSAYRFPATLRWIGDGNASLNKRQRELMEESFEKEPYSIAVIPCGGSSGRYLLLADRLYAHGTFFYVFGAAKSWKLSAEFNARRILTACLTPRCDKEYASNICPAALLSHWYGKIIKKQDKDHTEYLCYLRPDEGGIMKSEPLVCCLTAIYGAFLESGRTVKVTADEIKGGITVTFATDTENGSLSASDGIMALLCRFPGRTAHILYAAHIASSAGFTLVTHCAGDSVIARLTVPVYDVGELGFKAGDTVHTNTETCLAASLAIWF